MSLLLSPSTIEVLKNFASINQSLLFPKGNVLDTRSVKKHTYARAEIVEEIPKRFAIYDVNQFLTTAGQFDKPTLDFEVDDKFVRISDDTGGLSVDYHYADEEFTYVPDPKRAVKLPSVEVELDLNEIQLKSIITMSRVIGTPQLALESDGSELILRAFDITNTSTNSTKIQVGAATSPAVFSLVWKIEYLKLIPGTYTVSVSKQGLSRFQHKDMNLTYHILLEANSTKYEDNESLP